MLNTYSDIMSVKDVAEALHVGKNRVYELLENNQLKGFRMGRIWKISRDALENYINSQSGIN